MEMKCPACGYEVDETKTVKTSVTTRYKSGKRKGEIKSIEDKEIYLDKGKPLFREIKVVHEKIKDFELEVEECNYVEEYVGEQGYRWSYKEKSKCSLYACPKCSCVIMKEGWQ